jgi:peptidoglycan/LPS O-acetylase OafA/YrhL
MNFRQDINVMRALAVGMVLAFHFYPESFPSGYLGVDVFFVISGYLMTAIILKQVGRDDFSLVSFYQRRWFRVAPVLLALILALLIFGYFYFPDVDYRTLGKHGLAALGFFSNLIFFREIGSYFDDQSSVKWLLHTWSLAVEFQFYIIYPLVLSLVVRLFGVRALPVVLIAAMFASYCLFIALNFYEPSAAFYLLPARLWEFLAGGLAFILANQRYQQRSDLFWLLLLATVIVGGAIAYSNIGLSILASTITVASASIMILIGWSRASSNRWLYNNAVVNSTGKISYSLYVWHWPIAIAAVMAGMPILGLLFSIVIAACSYWAIEKKFTRLITKRTFAKWLFILCYLVFLGGMVLLYKFNGLPERDYPPLYQGATISEYRSCDHRGANDPCVFHGAESGNYAFAIVGDSLSLEFSDAIRQGNRTVFQYSSSGCNLFGSTAKCEEWSQNVVSHLLAQQVVERVYVIFRLMPTSKSEENAYIQKVVNYVQSIASKKDVTFIMSAPTLDISSSKYYFQVLFSGRSRDSILIDRRMIIDASDELRTRLKDALITEVGLTSVVDLKEKFCNKDKCKVSHSGKALYFDNIHPSMSGYLWALGELKESTRGYTDE